MIWDRIEGDWQRFKVKARRYWIGLTDEELDDVAGKREALIRTIERQYGVSRQEAECQVREWREGVETELTRAGSSAL